MKDNMKKRGRIISIGIILIFAILVIVLYIVGSRNYTFKILKSKLMYPERYEFIPTFLPNDATGWNIDGNRYLTVTIECTQQYIDKVTKSYDRCAIKVIYGKISESDSAERALIVTDKNQMYSCGKYELDYGEQCSYCAFNYQKDDVSNIKFYESIGDLVMKDGAIDTDIYDVREAEKYSDIFRMCSSDSVVYILYDNYVFGSYDPYSATGRSYIIVDKTNCAVTYFAS